MSWRNRPVRINTHRWERVRLQVFERDGYRCCNCGAAGRLECDHRTPLSRGGAVFDMSNLQSLCRRCHIQKTADENGGVSPAQRAARNAWRELLAAMVKTS